MARTPEGAVKKKVTGILIKHGAYYFSPVTGGFGASGVPDIVGCINGRFFAIECKANGNKPTTLQNSNIEDIKANGGQALVVDEHNIMDVEELMNYLKGLQL